jgi:hypothetical protein
MECIPGETAGISQENSLENKRQKNFVGHNNWCFMMNFSLA